MALIQKSIHVDEDFHHELQELMKDSRVQRKLAAFRKNAGENQLVRLILGCGLTAFKRQLFNDN